VSVQTVGWICDQATSKRRIRVAVTGPDVVELLVEVAGQQALMVELDAEGAAYLATMMAQALVQVLDRKDDA
jgi:hypothetical protein